MHTLNGTGRSTPPSQVARGPRSSIAIVSLILLSALMMQGVTAPPAGGTPSKAPSLSIDNAKVKEGDSGRRKLVFTVTLSRPSSARVHYRTFSGTATKSDFVAVHGSLRFTPSITSRRIVVKVIGDALHEADETFRLHLSNPKRARIADGVGRGTILDDDDLGGAGPVFSIGDVTVTEGSVGTTDAVFDVTASSSSTSPISVDFATSNGTAVASDYNPAGGTLVFVPGETAKQVTVQVIGDTVAEPSENFRVTLSDAIGATIVDAIGLGTITDDDSGTPVLPSISIGNVTVTEGNSGTTNAVFNVSLSATTVNTVTVAYATAPGSATSPADYVSTSGVLTFNPGETSKQITVQVVGDTISEANETYSVNLSAATNATISDDTGLGTITDNNTPTITISASTVTEGNNGTINAVFNVNLSASVSNTVTVNFATADGGATAPADYLSNAGVLTFNPGEVSKQVVVQVVGDILIETTETYSVSLSSPTNATIAGAGFALGTITDDDARTVTINSVTLVEGNAGTTNAVFTVTLSASSGNTITVDFATADGTAITPTDYTSVSGTVTFSPGQTTRTIIVPIVGDLVTEPDETYYVNLSNPTNATITGTGFGLGTITNND